MDDIFFEDPVLCSDCHEKFEQGMAIYVDGRCLCPKCYEQYQKLDQAAV